MTPAPLLEQPFPLAVPGPTAFYLALYLGTFVLHFAFMHYVFAGTAYIAWTSIFARITRDPFDEASTETVVRDWLPVMLSGAITAGIGPLLFVQILYKESFYTANLLLFHRWMAMLPVLILGFYGLYLLKWKGLARLPAPLSRFIGIIPFCCILFAAYTWTINHQLSLQSAKQWSEIYVTGTPPLLFGSSFLRVIFWFALAFPTFALAVSWQLRHLDHQNIPLAPQSVRSLARLALIGLCAGVISGSALIATMVSLNEGSISNFSRPYLALALIGFAVQALAWLAQLRSQRFSGIGLLTASLALFCTLLGIAVVREDLRLQTIAAEKLTSLFVSHSRAAEIGGMGAFVVCLILNTTLIAFCFLLVRRRSEP